MQELEGTDETLRHVGGGLEELNSILTATQKKINNRFKVRKNLSSSFQLD